MGPNSPWPNEPELLAVTQEDREAVAAFLVETTGMARSMATKADDHALTQAFARHRLDTRSPAPTAVGDVGGLRAAIVEAKWKIAAAVQAHSIDGVDGPPTDGEIAERAMQEARAAYDILSAALAQPQVSGGVDEAQALLLELTEISGDKAAAFTLREVGIVGTVFEQQAAAIQRALLGKGGQD